MQGAAGALDRRGQDLSTAIASLDGFAREADTALRLLDSQQEAVSGLVNRGGEVFSAPVFTWRLAAGILLGLLFRWRGIGAAAWAHGIFNLALSIGAGPDVFL